MAGVLAIEAAEKITASRKVQKVALVAVAPDGARSVDLESAVKQNFSKHGVASESLRTLFPEKPATVQELARLVQAQGYDSLLCMGPRNTIQIETSGDRGQSETLQNCLASYLSGKFPTGEPLEVVSVVEGAPLQVFKGNVRVFDLASQALIWESAIHVKMPANLRTSMQTSFLAREINKAIDTSGLLP